MVVRNDLVKREAAGAQRSHAVFQYQGQRKNIGTPILLWVVPRSFVVVSLQNVVWKLKPEKLRPMKRNVTILFLD